VAHNPAQEREEKRGEEGGGGGGGGQGGWGLGDRGNRNSIASRLRLSDVYEGNGLRKSHKHPETVRGDTFPHRVSGGECESVPMGQDEMRCIAVQCTMLNELCVEWRSYWTSFPPLSLSIEHMTWVICQRDMDEGSGRADLVEVYAVGRRRRW